MTSWLSRDGFPARAGVYAVKLALFLAVPGLHLMMSGRGRAGFLLFAVCNLAALILIFMPFEPTTLYMVVWRSCYLLLILSVCLTVCFVVLDIEALNKSHLSSYSFAAAAFTLVLVRALFSEPDGHGYFLANSDDHCPTICFGDLVVFKKMNGQFPKGLTIPIGSIVVRWVDEEFKLARIIGRPGETICVVRGGWFLESEQNKEACTSNFLLEDRIYFVDSKIYLHPHVRRDLRKGSIPQSEIVGIHASALTEPPGHIYLIDYLLRTIE